MEKLIQNPNVDRAGEKTGTSTLFQELTLGGVKVRNRIVIPPMCQHSTPDGLASDWHLIHLGSLALSGAGLMIIEATAVSAEARITRDCLGLWSDAQADALGAVLSKIRRYSNIRFGAQLSHAGRKASSRSPSTGGRGPLPEEEGGWRTVSASPIPFGDGWPAPIGLDRDGMEEVIGDFVQAARRADHIGLDVLELHAAHGYLLSSFLSPLANTRSDEYGGTLENRMRFPLQVVNAVRGVWPRGKALGVRINGTDWLEGGITPEEAVKFSTALETMGCDFIDVSSGGNAYADIPLRTGYQVPFASAVRNAVSIPVIAVGLIKDPLDAQRILDEGLADLVAVGRGHLHNPHWTWEAAEDLGGKVSIPHQYSRAATRAGKPVERWMER